jgi:hypothetical protein
MSLRLLDPTGDALKAELRLAPRPETLERLSIGLLANGKTNSEALLRETARLFVERHGCSVVAEENKGNATQICAPAMLQSIAERADLLITAVGD